MFKNQKNIHQILLKPTWGRMSLSPDSLNKLVSDILEEALDFYNKGGKIFIIPHAIEQDLVAQAVLSSLYVRIRRCSKDSIIFLPDTDFSTFTELYKTEILLIPNLPKHSKIISWLSQNEDNQLIIATGVKSDWEKISIELPSFYYEFPSTNNSWIDYFEYDIKNEFEAYEKLSLDEKTIFERVIALDSLGIPIPIALLANSLKIEVKEAIDLATEIEEKGLIYWIEDEKEANLFVSSNATQISQKLIENISLTSKQLEELIVSIISSVEYENKDERYTILNLFQVLLINHVQLFRKPPISRRLVREIIKTYRNNLREIWSAGDEIECLLWGKVLEDFQLFDLSKGVFQKGLDKNKNNPFLKHAMARMVGEWSRVSFNAKLEVDAEDLFSKLIDDNAFNPYFWQSFGVFESRRKRFSEAEKHFRNALEVSEGEENKVFVLTAWANIEMERNNFSGARAKLNEISSNSKSPFIPHLWAKLSFYEGDYQEAFRRLKELFAIQSLSIEGWNMLGESALKRAHWQKARTALETALSIDSENPQTLRALGDLETDLGKLEREKYNVEIAEAHFQKAREYFAQLLDFDLFNVYGECSKVVLLREEGKFYQQQNESDKPELYFNKAVQDLKELYKKYPNDEFISHNLGETYLSLKQFEKAKDYFNETSGAAGAIGLAKAEIASGNLEGAIEHLNTVEEELVESQQKQFEEIRILNSLAEVWITLDILEKDKKEYLERAIDLVDESLKLDAKNGFTLRLYAKIKRQAEQTEESESLEKEAQDLAREELEDFLTE